MRVAIDFVTVQDVQESTEAVKNIESDVRLVGKDENGHDWNLSAKSLYGSLVLAKHAQENKERVHTAHNVDWNTIYCECDEDIYGTISKYVKNGTLAN